jgi:lipopolysaccharide transport system ATP-binding protein
MPILLTGNYSITVAIAEGTQSEHIQHEWRHDALMFQSHSTSCTTGLIGIPMKNITLKNI